MALMKSWVDTVAADDNIWLVLVFHGIGIGWEPKTGAELREYLQYMKGKEHRLWVATFQDVTKYMREREHAKVRASRRGNAIEVTLTHDLDGRLYDLPLTLETTLPADWSALGGLSRSGKQARNLPSGAQRRAGDPGAEEDGDTKSRSV